MFVTRKHHEQTKKWLEEKLAEAVRNQVILDTSRITLRDIKPGAEFYIIENGKLLHRTLHTIDGKWALFTGPSLDNLTRMGQVDTPEEVLKYIRSSNYLKKKK